MRWGQEPPQCGARFVAPRRSASWHDRVRMAVAHEDDLNILWKSSEFAVVDQKIHQGTVGRDWLRFHRIFRKERCLVPFTEAAKERHGKVACPLLPRVIVPIDSCFFCWSLAIPVTSLHVYHMKQQKGHTRLVNLSPASRETSFESAPGHRPGGVLLSWGQAAGGRGGNELWSNY